MKTNNKGPDLWEKAKSIIPGGNQLLSKRAEIFLPELWPSYYSKASGCKVWDLEGNEYFDFASMGISSCVLGYSDKQINSVVKSVIDAGAMSTLNCYEEINLAEKLLDLHPWAQMVRFSKTGGEACAIAIRISRAATNKDHVAFCGYHGWHDWYLSANLNDSTNLDQHLLDGLNPSGIPIGLANTAHPFNFNDIKSLEKIISTYSSKIGTIILEPQREIPPQNQFLEKIRELATKNNIVLIFDEITSGFRENIGGIHLKKKVQPDIAIFGKAMGNGYPISAIVGKRGIMDSAQDSFISSTMWTDRIGFAAGIATINKMIDYSVPSSLIKHGLRIKNGWKNVATQSGVSINVYGLDTIPKFRFNYDNAIELETYFTQEMLKRGYLAKNSTATTFAYDSKIIDDYLNNVQIVFEKIKKLNYKVSDRLIGAVKHIKFNRLTSGTYY